MADDLDIRAEAIIREQARLSDPTVVGSGTVVGGLHTCKFPAESLLWELAVGTAWRCDCKRVYRVAERRPSSYERTTIRGWRPAVTKQIAVTAVAFVAFAALVVALMVLAIGHINTGLGVLIVPAAAGSIGVVYALMYLFIEGAPPWLSREWRGVSRRATRDGAFL